MMRPFVTALVLIANIAVQAASFGAFDIGAEALYWRPSYGGIQLGTQINTNLNATDDSLAIMLRPKDDWGFGVGGRYCSPCTCFDLGARYVHYNTSHTRFYRAPRGFVFSPSYASFTALATTVDGETSSHYRHLDVDAGFHVIRCGAVRVRLIAGGRYFKIKERENYLYDSQSESAQSYISEGGGLRLGIGGTWTPVCKGLTAGLRGHLAYAAGFGTSRLHIVLPSGGQPITNTPPNPAFPSSPRLLPGIDVAGVFFIRWNLSCMSFEGNVGYELNFYPGARRRLDGFGAITNKTPVDSHIGYGGLVAGVRVGF